MKHTLKITLFLLLIFLLSHFIGLIIINNYLPKTLPSGEIIEKKLPLNIEKPQIEENTSFITIFITLLIGSFLALLLIKFQLFNVWKFWFFISVALTLSIAFNAFFKESIAVVLSLIITSIRTFKPNMVINNFSEVFIYGGLSAIFVPILNLFSIAILLILISVYDFYAVYKSKHMIKLAKFQTKSKLFAGINFPYKRLKEKKVFVAILGGGDIGFTLFFSGVILKEFNLLSAFLSSLIISLSLLGLFLYSKKGKYYPAMPVLSIGCLIAYLIVKFLL